MIEDFLYGGKFDKEKLILEVWTDGSRKPSETFFEAMDIVENVLQPLRTVLEEPIKPVRLLLPNEDMEFKRRRLANPISAILKSELPSKLVRAIERAGINTFGELLKHTPENLREEYGFSEEDVALIEEAVKRLGFEMGKDYWKELEEASHEA
jgi:DNA-directed RNA polymerase subunit alpha